MGMKFTVLDRQENLNTHRLADLCQYLMAKVVSPFLVARGVQSHPQFKEDCFSPHAESHPFEPTGTIDFFPPPLLLGDLRQLEEALEAELRRIGIKAGMFVREDFPGRLVVRVIHIPILENPTVENCPPEVTMSRSAARLVLRDLLGFQPRNGQLRLTASDLLQRLSLVTDEKIRNCCRAPLRDRGASAKLSSRPSAFTEKRIRRCVSELELWGQWAIRHRFENLHVG